MTALSLLDHASVFVFALTGALVASRAQLDIVGFVFLACLTAVGGGTVRDLLLDRNPVFWLGAPSYVLLAAGAAVLVFFTAHLMESRYRWVLWLDSLALGIAVSAGVAAAQSLGQSGVITVVMGVMTGCMGGLMRDVVANEVPLVLKQGELYISAAFGGAIVAVLTASVLPGVYAQLGLCTLVTWGLRAGSLAFGWRLPVYKARPPRQK